MQVKETIAALSKLDENAEICVYWQSRPDDIHIYTWAWICDNFKLEMLREFNNIFCNAIQSLKELYPYDIRVASGDVIFIEKETNAKK